jgi:hypothetical protein
VSPAQARSNVVRPDVCAAILRSVASAGSHAGAHSGDDRVGSAPARCVHLAPVEGREHGAGRRGSIRAAGKGCRVVLVSSGWEKLGVRAARERKGYSVGWGAILEVFAGRHDAAVVFFATISRLIRFVLWMSGRLEREIENAGGAYAVVVMTIVAKSPKGWTVGRS